ncbi:hypothetical protein CVU76_01985 [Candidatus Dojkabacteria bacterium HGW-Dojkabacteria-1]|uniref:GerMN domain-containing protein n=1 Tax=Candidatus Dojkabacteria bacterium HGW-Dojkabacteria-1 TaxID=2013761 RepID=A0A2N2F3L9_9BACT|nr:MAG: hypothetical protein CVU76_01985 [Candidatus Dojkabacteria bacterium HGW-Dojkabacteria-1]
MIKNLVLIISIILLSVVLILFSYLLKEPDLCCKYEVCTKFTNICENSKSVLQLKTQEGVRIYLENVKHGDEIELGYVIRGSVTGSWYFEGEFPVRVLNEEMEVVETLIAFAKEDWMTSERVPFELEVDFPLIADSYIVLRFEKSNPSGLIENSDYADLQILVKTVNEALEVKVYFPNENMGSTSDCTLVYPVNRTIPYTQAVGRAALEQLFKGVTTDEEDFGYFTNINEGVKIQSLTISNGIARVDLSEELEREVGGSCRVTSIREQINRTLGQFSTVDTVIISVDGRTEDILQP